jgi:hypothetical protein
MVDYISSMKFVCTALAALVFMHAKPAFSQTDTVKINMTIYDGGTKKPLSGVNVINPKSSTTASTNASGFVQVTATKRDTIFLFCPGYRIRQYSAADSAPKKEYRVQLTVEPLTITTSHDLVIKAPKTLEQIEEERNHLGITPKELERDKIYPSSPISALYDMFSKREKEKETLKKQIAVEDRNKVFKELLNYYNEKKIIDLPADHYDDFIRFANLPTEFLKNHSDYEIMKTVKTLYDKYARLSGLVK